MARPQRASRDTLRRWLAAAAVAYLGYAAVLVVLQLMIDAPSPWPAWLAGGLVAFPAAALLAARLPSPRVAERALTEATSVAGLAVLVAAVYLVVVVGISGAPRGAARGVLIASLVAAMVAMVLAVPARYRLVELGRNLVGNRRGSVDDLVATFGARMTRSVPMDELLLQLVETLSGGLRGATSEIWTGTDGLLTRTVSMPSRPHERLVLADRERAVVGQARIGGSAWAAVWLPTLVDRTGELRVAPIAHLGELLGLIVVHRPADAPAFTTDDERALVELARQLGLALHNVRLDSALQASLEELAERNRELQASRLRIVNAADTSRRAIERNLHDGAQQHLVALAVKLGLAHALAEDGEVETLLPMLEKLRGDVQTTITELRELAHGIYPPLLRDRGLGEALHTAAARSAQPCTVDVRLDARYPEPVETAAYFCCLEAMQNAAKYAGDTATIAIEVTEHDGELSFAVVDDGAGFDVDTTGFGNGFLNMQDRLGALGGTLTVRSSPGRGTCVRAVIPASPRES